MLNTSNTAGIVPGVVPLKQGPNKRLPDFLIAFLRCSLANKPINLLRRLYQFLWKSTVKTNPDDWEGQRLILRRMVTRNVLLVLCSCFSQGLGLHYL